MHLIFLYGPPATGKFTIGRLVAERSGIALFHNHLIVDAVGAVFPFGSEEFVRLREAFWIETIRSAVLANRSLVFTFAPEPTVASDFPDRLGQIVVGHGGHVFHVALTVTEAEQERRIEAPERAAFGKLRSIEVLRAMRASMSACMEAMPTPVLRIDTGATNPSDAADTIIRAIVDRTAAPPADR